MTESPRRPRESYGAETTQYAEDVVAGRIVAGRLIRLACERHLRDLERQATPGFPYYFCEWYAGDVCDFVEGLPHIEGSWETTNIHLEAPQIWLLGCVFGWRRVETEGRTRRFTRVYIEMARKGAKSTITGGVALYSLTSENEIGPQIIIGATTAEQAQKVFNPAKQMVMRTQDLREECQLQTWARSITCEGNGGFIQPINSKGKTQDGWNPHMAVLDELHAHKDRGLYDVIASAFGSRKNPLMWMITTAGYNTNGVCYEQRQYVQKVLEGTLEAEHLFGAVFTVDEGDDPFDEKTWPKANPMIGVTPTWDSMRSYAADAKASPSAEGEFKTKRLNVWMNATTAWLSVAQWLACGDDALSWDEFKGLDCYIGADLADKDDITAAAVVAVNADGVLLCKTAFWLPQAVLEDPVHAEGRGPAPYRTWAKQGHLMLTPGNWVDHNEVRDWFDDRLDTLSVLKCTFDQFAAAQAMASAINQDMSGGEDLAVILHKRASNVTDPAKELEARVKVGPAKLRHDNNPVMNWMASNVTVARRRDETLLPVKETQDSPNKIDGIDALINAIHPITLPKEEPPVNPYNDIELMVL